MIENQTNLFYILQNLFDYKYQFSRPHICQKNISELKFLSTKNIAIFLLGENRSISREAFMNLSRRVKWSETTADLIFYQLEEEYARISDDIYILYDDFLIDNESLNMISKILHTIMRNTEYISMIGYQDFEDYPKVKYQWNTFLLTSIIKKYGLGFKLISPKVRYRRFNKEIIVLKEKAYEYLSDIVYEMLKKNNIDTIDEANLLSFLVINHLANKVIPKELFEAKSLNYNDGYFSIK